MNKGNAIGLFIQAAGFDELSAGRLPSNLKVNEESNAALRDEAKSRRDRNAAARSRSIAAAKKSFV